MKILYFTSSFPEKSSVFSSIFLFYRIKKLLENKIDVNVVKYYTNPIFFHKPQNFFKREKKSYKTSVFNLLPQVFVNVFKIDKFYIPKTYFVHYSLKKLKNYFFKNKFDIIHSHFVWDSNIPFLLKKKYNIPYILTAHGSDIHTIPFQSEYQRIKTLKILENAAKVIFVSNYLLSKAKEFGYSDKNSVVIPNGVDTGKFKFIQKNPVKLRTGDEKIIGFVGSLLPVKRAEILSEIFYEIQKINKKVRFVIIGKGILKKIIFDKIETYNLKNKVFYYETIHPDKMPYYYNNFDCLILPSREEGWACVINEARACGVPVVGSACGGIPEVIGDCGKIVADGGNFIKDFSKTVAEVISVKPDRRKIIEYAKLFDINKTILKEIEAYKNLLF